MKTKTKRPATAKIIAAKVGIDLRTAGSEVKRLTVESMPLSDWTATFVLSTFASPMFTASAILISLFIMRHYG